LKATISPQSGGTIQRQWYQNGRAVMGGTDTSLKPQAGNQGLGDYQFRVIDSTGSCALSPAFKVLSAAPKAIIAGMGDTTVVVGNTKQLSDSSTNASTRIWLLCDDSQTNSKRLTIMFKDTGKCCVLLRVYEGPCADSIKQCFRVISKPSIFIPNLFTPNKDGINDVFEVKGEGIKALDCIIYNRWGQKLYSWDGVHGFWDGMINGNIAGNGTYFFLINYTDLENKSVMERGVVTLEGN